MGAREVAMIMGCLEKFSARREREADDSKRIFYRKERLGGGKNREEDIDRNDPQRVLQSLFEFM